MSSIRPSTLAFSRYKATASFRFSMAPSRVSPQLATPIFSTSSAVTPRVQKLRGPHNVNVFVCLDFQKMPVSGYNGPRITGNRTGNEFVIGRIFFNYGRIYTCKGSDFKIRKYFLVDQIFDLAFR